MQNQLQKGKIQEVVQQVTVVPQQLRPVEDNIESCIKEVTLDGVYLMEQQGGYITIPADIIPRSATNPFSNSLQLFSGLSFEVPYWSYEAANGIQQSQMPSLNGMNAELSKYINNNLAVCTKNLTSFSDYGYSIDIRGDADAKTTIHDENIIISVNYPVYMETKGVSKLV